MKNKLGKAIGIIIIFVVLRYTKYFYGHLIFGQATWEQLSFDVKVSMINYTQICIGLIATYLLFKQTPFKPLGLGKSLWKEIIVAFLITLPMFIGFGLLNGFKFDYDVTLFHRDMVLAGFFEEFMFRGFIFGLLFFYCSWGFIPAILLPSIYFGLGHLYQADNLSEALSVFAFTSLASAGFAWFYVAWDSLWFVLFLHGFMDIAWTMAAIDTNVTGSWEVNLFRFTTLGLAIFFSIREAKANKRYNLSKKLWINNESK